MEEHSFRRVAATPEKTIPVGAGILGLALLALGLAILGVASTPSPPAAEASSCRNAHAKPAKLSRPEARRAVICLINKKRRNAGKGALRKNRRLNKAAQRHTGRMHGSGCFAHQCPGEPGLDTRLRKAGYLHGGLRSWKYGENVAWGKKKRGSPAKVVRAWMRSSGHRQNILSGSFRELGIGFNSGTPTRKRASGGIFTVDFGMRAG